MENDQLNKDNEDEKRKREAYEDDVRQRSYEMIKEHFIIVNIMRRLNYDTEHYHSTLSAKLTSVFTEEEMHIIFPYTYKRKYEKMAVYDVRSHSTPPRRTKSFS